MSLLSEAQEKAILAQRQAESHVAAQTLYARIQELENHLVSQRMITEQNKSRELSLHRTLEGLSQLVESKQKKIVDLEERVSHLEHLENAARRQLRQVTDELENTRRRERGLVASSLDHGARADWSTRNDGALVFDAYGGSSNETLVNEIQSLRRQLGARTHEAQAAMLALHGLLGLKEAEAPANRLTDGNGTSLDAYRCVAALVVDAIQQRQLADLIESNGSMMSTVALPGVAAASPAPMRENPRLPQLQHGSGASDSATAASSSPAALRMTVQLLSRENLELKQRLHVLESPSR